MKEYLKKVEEFQLVTEQEVNKLPKLVDEASMKFRYDLALEELEEYREACSKGDMTGILDALTDQLYILLGTFNTFGLSSVAESAFDEVHRSNMSKLDDNGKPIKNEFGKVTKSKNYSPPQLEKFVINNF